MYDVAVLGAGPAGAVAAWHLARAGARVILLERASLPRYKTCGGGLIGRALAALPVDVSPLVERRSEAVDLHVADAGVRVRCAQPDALVTLAMRAVLDHRLACAAGEAGAELAAPCPVTAVEPGQDRVTLATPRGRIAARFVVAADGATGLAARAAGWPPNPATVPALECEVSVAPATFDRLAQSPRFDFGVVPHGYGWVFPKRAHLSVGVLSTRRSNGVAGDRLQTSLQRYFAHVGLDRIERVERHGYLIPARPLGPPFVRRRVLLVGDAGGFADPVTLEGISFAARTAALAAQAIIDGDGDPPAVAARYDRALAADVLPELAVARRLATILYDRPPVRRWLFRVAGQRFGDAVAAVMAGRLTYRAVARRPLARLVLAVAGAAPRLEGSAR
jgi:geranylgeranyl reductase family protein